MELEGQAINTLDVGWSTTLALADWRRHLPVAGSAWSSGAKYLRAAGHGERELAGRLHGDDRADLKLV